MRTPASEPTLPLATARGLAFLALAAFGALHWMVLLEPAAPERALYALGAGGVALLGLLACRRLSGRPRYACATAVGAVAVALGLLGGGVADELLVPDAWGTLASGIGRGITALPGIRVPYRGVDEWARAVIGMGGTLLVVAAALVAFWPRRRTTGYPPVALGLLVALYAIPAVALDFENEFLRGAALALLVLAFLRLEKLRIGDVGTAGMVAAGVAVLALMLAPALDGDRPWWDYEAWALGAASARSTAFSWDHGYGPLDWPRDGRELLRVRARRAAYWKAANLETFDGIGWRQVEAVDDDTLFTVDDERLERETQEIEVSVRNLSSRTYITAGFARAVESPTVRETPIGDGTWVAGRALRRGDAYAAEVYTPDSTARERRAAPLALLPAELAGNRRLFLGGSGDFIGQSGAPRYQLDFPQFGFPGEVMARRANGTQPQTRDIVSDVLEEGPYRRSWALARRLKDGARTQEDFVQRVMSHLADGYSYTETPPEAAETLEGFLFDARRGYCQQFSGAMALLLRMGGVPARVSTGFTSGSKDSKTGEFVVRDLDAHSWVEVWYSGIGWVTFDPTPAAAPARAQPAESDPVPGSPSSLGTPGVGGDRPSDPGRRGLADEAGTSRAWIAAGAAGGVLLLAAAAALLVRRRRRAGTPQAAVALGELERALRRARLNLGPQTTLSALEARFSRSSPAAAGYVRAVRDLRYGGRAGAPTPAQRRGLRSELGRGSGLAGRLRAWWALPPRTW